jgi:hypothetical protein
MISFALGDVRETFTNLFNAHLRTWVGAAFVAVAMLAIQYEEVVAPNVSRISNAWSAATAKLTNLSL